MSKHIRICMIAGLALATLDAHAACPLRDLAVDGVVVDDAGQPVAGATIETRWTEKLAGQIGNRRESAADGRFQVRVQFDPFGGKSFTGKERCDFPFDAIELAVSHAGFRTLTQRFEPDKLPPTLELRLEPAR